MSTWTRNLLFLVITTFPGTGHDQNERNRKLLASIVSVVYLLLTFYSIFMVRKSISVPLIV